MIPKEILKKVKQIEIKTRGIVNDILSGEYHSAFKGQGMEFAEVREYALGDDIRHIDWNVTARAEKPFVKRFEEERELTVMLVVDISKSSQFGTSEQMKGEIAIEIAALLAFSAIKNSDKVGLILFTDRIEKYIPPQKGKGHVLRVIRELLYFKPEGEGTDVAKAVDYLNRVCKKKVTSFILSDFISDDFAKPLQIAGKRHDLIAIKVTDPRESSLPDIGLIEFEDAETGELIILDTSDLAFQENFLQSTMEEKEELDNVLKQIGVDLIHIHTNEPYIHPLVRFFKSREAKYH